MQQSIFIKTNPESPFEQVSANLFRLKPGAWSEPSAQVNEGGHLKDQVGRHNRQIRIRLLEELKQIPPRAFEHLIDHLLERWGYEGASVSRYSGDGGIDVQATMVGGVPSVRSA